MTAAAAGADVTELLFIRHGETDWNRQQRFQGQLDVPLNANGHEQAARMARRLAGDRHERLVTSDLLRARQTAEPLAAAWGVEPEPMAGFREQAFGVLEGLDGPTVRERHPDLWAAWIRQRGDYALPGGGESLRAFHDRVMAALHGLAEAAVPGSRIAVVTHGGVLDLLWRSVNGLPLDGARQCEIPNTGINRLRWVGGALQLERWADADHLQGFEELPGVVSAQR